MTLKKWLLSFLALGAAAALGVGSWAALQFFHVPAIRPLPPRVVTRPAPPGPITLVLGGDTAPTDAAQPLLDQHGYRYPYLATQPWLAGADLAFVNLESPVTAGDTRFPGTKKYVYKVHPDAVAAWQWLGVDLVSLANNHVMDYQAPGLMDTLDHLDRAGIQHVGGGRTDAEARQPLIFDVGGTRIGFLAYQEDRLDELFYYRAFARGQEPGCARLVRSSVEEDVRRLRPLVDILVVSVHWGMNYAPVTRAQEDTGRWLADLGVDLVAGHHAHDVQPVEVRGSTVILYSLGNYAFGTIGKDTLRVGFLAQARITPRQGNQPARLERLVLQPIVNQNRLVNYQPRPLAPQEVPWLDPVRAASRAYGTELTLEGTTLVVPLPRR